MPNIIIICGSAVSIAGGGFLLWFSRGYMRLEPRTVFDGLALFCFGVAGFGIGRVSGLW